MTFGNSCEEYNYTMKKSGTPLTLNRCNEECDLGVLFASNIKFSKHIKQITRKANSAIGIVKQSFSCLDKTMFRTSMLVWSIRIWNMPLRFGTHI